MPLVGSVVPVGQNYEFGISACKRSRVLCLHGITLKPNLCSCNARRQCGQRGFLNDNTDMEMLYQKELETLLTDVNRDGDSRPS